MLVKDFELEVKDSLGVYHLHEVTEAELELDRNLCKYLAEEEQMIAGCMRGSNGFKLSEKVYS